MEVPTAPRAVKKWLEEVSEGLVIENTLMSTLQSQIANPRLQRRAGCVIFARWVAQDNVRSVKNA